MVSPSMSGSTIVVVLRSAVLHHVPVAELLLYWRATPVRYATGRLEIGEAEPPRPDGKPRTVATAFCCVKSGASRPGIVASGVSDIGGEPKGKTECRPSGPLSRLGIPRSATVIVRRDCPGANAAYITDMGLVL